MKIVRLTAENLKRLKAVEIEPDGTMQVVTGRNAQGKTSVLDAIWLALGGGPAARETKRPVRDGEDQASVELDLGDLIVHRHWSVTGNGSLTVTSPDGARYSSPQGMLDALVGRLSFDPLQFTRLSARQQVEALLELVDLDVDLDELARQRADAYERRTEVGRDLKRAQSSVEMLGRPEDAPDREVSATELLNRIAAARGIANMQLAERQNRDRLALEIEQLEERLAGARADLAESEAAIGEHEPHEDVAILEGQLGRADRVNAAVRRNIERAGTRAAVESLTEQRDQFSKRIEVLDETKARALAEAKFPVDGLGFDDSGVTYRQIPFSQASAAEQIRVSLGMAMALNPRLRVIRILDGSLLDADNLKLIAEMAKEHDFQIWLETVSDPSGMGVVIEDGEVAAS